MFSWSKISEKIKKQEKHWKKHYSVKKEKAGPLPSLEEVGLSSNKSVSEDLILLNTGVEDTEANQKLNDNHSQYIKSNEKKCGLSWRFYNNLESECNESAPPANRLKLGIKTPKIKKSKDKCVNLHKTCEAIQNKNRRRFKEHRKKKIKARRKMALSCEKPSSNLTKENEIPSKLENEDCGPPPTSDYNFDREMAEFLKAINEDTAAVNEDTAAEAISTDSSKLVTDPNKYTNLLKESDDVTSVFCSKEDRLYLSSIIVGGDSLLVALFPETKIYIAGYYKVCLIVGSVSLLGYVFKEGEERTVLAPLSHSIPYLNVTNGIEVKRLQEEKLQELEIPVAWVTEFNVPSTQRLTIIKLTRHESNVTRILAATKMVQNYEPKTFDLDLWKEVVGVKLIEEFSRTEGYLQPFRELAEWSGFIENLQPLLHQQKDIRCIVAGGGNVGKSSFVRFLLNGLLSHNCIDEVACLDLDPGQSELSLPCSLSLSVIKSPLLGQAFTHRDNVVFSLQKAILIGDFNVGNVAKEYLDNVETLMYEFHKLRPSLPLVVNTMGFARGAGVDIMMDVLKIVQPSHVVVINSTESHRNFSCSFDSVSVSKSRRGIERRHPHQLEYELIEFESVSGKKGTSSNRFLRGVNIVSYFAKLWKNGEIKMVPDTLKPPVRIDWTSVAIHVYGSYVPHTHILQAINASLVALCKVKAEFLEVVGMNVPMRIQDSRSWNRLNFCIGWGIVRGIDPTTSEIYILTPLSQDVVMDEVNAIVLCKSLLPDEFVNLFAKEGAPYWQVTDEKKSSNFFH